MGASTEKKRRQEAREAGTDKKIIAAKAEAEKAKKSKIKWTLGTVAVVLLLALTLFLNSSFFYTSTTAASVGDENYSPAELSYYYANQYYTWLNQYGGYASLFGLDTSMGIAGLGSQQCTMAEGYDTWKDYFLDAASQQMIQTKALCDYAKENGIELGEEEIATVEASFDGMDEYVKAQGYANVDKFFAANYGRGVDSDVVYQAGLDASLANMVLEQVSGAIEYTDAELEEYYVGLNGESDMFDFAYYYVASEKVSVEAEDGTTTEETNEETKAAAKATAEAILAAYEEAEGDDVAARFDAAVAAELADAVASYRTNTAGSSLGVYKEWLMGERSEGDASVVENTDGAGYYVVVFQNRGDNHYNLAQARHILVKAVASEDGTYTDEAKVEAKARAEEIYKEWQAGEMTEESFAALANEYSEDGGSNTNGGLYDAIAKGQMVEEFDEFCFAGHEPGETAVIYGESASYAGYHVMYYVGEGMLYSDYIAKNNLLSEDMDEWLVSLTESYEFIKGSGYGRV